MASNKGKRKKVEKGDYFRYLYNKQCLLTFIRAKNLTHVCLRNPDQFYMVNIDNNG